jgi:hypothetical protein
MRMEWFRGIAPSFEASFGLPDFGASHVVREIVRAVAVLGLLALLVYCLHAVWIVLRQLEHVQLAEIKHALDVVSVRDAVLCVVGYKVGTELLRAVVRARRGG